MSGVTAMTVLAGAAVAGTAYSIYAGEKASSAQKKAQSQATESATKQASLADQAMNKADQKRPNTASILSDAQQAGRSGPSGTMLTGPQGIEATPGLGKKTLLGG